MAGCGPVKCHRCYDWDYEHPGTIDWDEVEKLLLEMKPRHSICEERPGRPDFLENAEERADDLYNDGCWQEEGFFWNEGRPVDCISTRYEGVNYRVSMLIGFAGCITQGRITNYNPNYWNNLSVCAQNFRGNEQELARLQAARWMLMFVRALDHTKRTGGKLVQPLQIDHEDEMSDMQKAERLVAQHMGIPVVEFKFEAFEVPSAEDYMREDIWPCHQAFMDRLEEFLLEHDLA